MIFSLRRIGAIAQVTLIDALRQRTLRVILLFAIVVVWGGDYFSQLALGERVQYVKDFGAGAIHLFGMIIIMLLAGQSIPQEVENRVLHTLFARPVRAWEYLIGKFLGLMAMSGVVTLIMTFMLWGEIRWMESELMYGQTTPDVVEAVLKQTRDYQWVGAVGLVYLRFCLITTLALVISTVATSQVFTVSTTVLVYLSSSMLASAKEAVSVVGRSDGFQYFFVTLMTWVLPDLESFRAVDELLAGHAVGGQYILLLTAYTLAYSGVVLVLGAGVFSRREI